MSLPASGEISLSQVRAELGGSGAVALGDSNVRSLAGVSSGAISLDNLHGKAATTLAVSLSAYSASNASNVSTYTFGANTRTITGGTGSETTTWTVLASSGGTWDFPGGSSGASAAPRVSGVAAGASATATIRCTVTNGTETTRADANYLYINTSIA